MNFLKNLFSGFTSSSDDGIYLYVKPKACDEIVKVRLNLKASLSRRDDGDGYFMRKMVSGKRCPFQSELELYFDNHRNLTEKHIERGEFVTEADYIAKYGADQPE